MLVSLEELAQNAVHFGHKTSRWNPKMKKYIYSASNGVHVFDLNKTAEGLKNTVAELEKLAKKGKTILFVSTKPQTKVMLEEFRESTGYPIVVNKWVGGMMTNFETIKGRVKEKENSIQVLDIAEMIAKANEL